MKNLKRGLYKIFDKEEEQLVIENQKDLEAFFKAVPQQNILGLKKAYTEYINRGEVVILDVKSNVTGCHGWRNEGIENFVRIKLLN